jgi:hypothetical protein
MLDDNQPHWIYPEGRGYQRFLLDLMIMAAAGGYTFIPPDATTGFRDLAAAEPTQTAARKPIAGPAEALAVNRNMLDGFVDDLVLELPKYIWIFVPGVGLVPIPVPGPGPQPDWIRPGGLTNPDLLDLAARFHLLSRLAPGKTGEDLAYARDRLYDVALTRLRAKVAVG